MLFYAVDNAKELEDIAECLDVILISYGVAVEERPFASARAKRHGSARVFGRSWASPNFFMFFLTAFAIPGITPPRANNTPSTSGLSSVYLTVIINLIANNPAFCRRVNLTRLGHFAPACPATFLSFLSLLPLSDSYAMYGIN